MIMKIGEKTISPTKIICIGTNYLDHIEETKSEIPKEKLIKMSEKDVILTLKIAMVAVFMAVGITLSYLNPFGYLLL
ncbi:unnamed protein product, partial [marine sediment metagenome]